MEQSRIKLEKALKLATPVKKDFIPLFSGRPLRDTVIGKEEILNLEIALNTARSLEEFIAQV